ncbi:hypothetical protein GM658_28520, partial [Pseudoduganella eburnea]
MVEQQASQSKSSGFSAGITVNPLAAFKDAYTELFAGYHNEKHLDNSHQVTQVASNVGSLNGDVVLTAGQKYTQAASNITAGNDVNISAKSIDITALDNTGSNRTANSDLKIGAFARISSPLIDLVNNVN